MPGLGPLTIPEPQPFSPSGNPILDEIQRAHSTLSPAAQRAVGLSGIPQRIGDAEAATPGAQPAPVATPQAPRPIASPSSLNVRGLGPAPSAAPAPTQILGGEPRPPAMQTPVESPEAAHLAERNRLVGAGSGTSQIHNPFLRGLATVGGAVGSAVLPNVLRFVPGTELHHRDLVNQAEGVVNQDVARGKAAAETGEAAARGESLLHPAKEWKPGTEPEIDPQHPELGPQAVWYNQSDPTQKHFGGAPVAAKPTTAEWKSGTEPEIDPQHPELGPQAVWYNGQDPTKKQYGGAPVAAKPTEGKEQQNVHVLPDGTVVGVHHDPKTGKSSAEVLYKGDPKVAGHVIQRKISGQDHNILVNSQTGEDIKDLGEVGVKPPTADHGFTAVAPDGRVIRLEPGQTAPTGFTTPNQAGSLSTPSALTKGAGEQGEIINRAGDNLIRDIQANRDKVGNLGSYWNQFTNQSPISDPTASRLISSIASFAALQPRLHGMRSHEAMREFEKMIGGIPKNPDSLIEAIKGIQGTAGVVSDVAKGRPAGGAVPTVTTKAQFDALPKGAEFIEDGKRLRKQ